MSQDFVPGQRLGDYEILGVLGAGGMGKVYKVRNVISDRVEAMKILLPNLASQKELADRFLREIKVLASLDHPNIAALRTALTLDDQLVMIMEYVEGVTVASRLKAGPLPPAEAVNYTDQVLAALSYAHKLDVVHRDIKPGNMMLTPQGVIKLMDFGIARSGNEGGLTMTGTTLGSLNYMPPEQVKAQPVDARSDLYSLGVSLYEMVTGELPFKGDSGFSLMSAHLEETPRPPINLRPDLPPGLNDIILMNLEKDPEMRFQSADAFRNALKNVDLSAFSATTAPRPAAAVAVTASPQPTTRVAAAPVAPVAAAMPMPPPSHQPGNSNRGLYMTLGALIVLVVLVAAGFYVPRMMKTNAGAGTTATAPAAPALPPTAPAAPAPASAAAASPAPSAAQSQADASAKAAQEAGAAAAAKAAADAAAQAAAEKAAALKEVSQEADQIASRAAAVSQSLETLKRQMAAQGLGLRGDIAAAQDLMQTDLSRGQAAIDKQDPDEAKEYLDKASAQAEKIEKFLGR